MSAPAVLFLVFNRPDTTARVMEAIRAARPPRLYVAADGARHRPGEAEGCAAARQIATSVDWPCKVHTLFRDENLGCHQAVGGAISRFFAHEEEGIILEDDCLPSADFFRFCAQLLERFRAEPRVMAICGSCYATPAHPLAPASYDFSYYADMWGWATWRRAWRLYDHELARWPVFKANGGLKALAGGRLWRESDWADKFDACLDGRVDSWGYRWIYSVIEQNGLACYPVRNLVCNIGYRPDATHTKAIPGQALPRIANRTLQTLAFPLAHPTTLSRSKAMERRIEAVRLGLAPLSARAKVKAVARRVLGERRFEAAKHIARGALNWRSRLLPDPDGFLKTLRLRRSCRSKSWAGARPV